MDSDGPTGAGRQRRFVGRANEIERLLTWLRAAAQGSGTIVLVRGEAGVGKSRLLQEFTDRAREHGATIMWGSCFTLGASEIPYAPLLDALRRLNWEIGSERVRELAGPGLRYLAPLLGLDDDPDASGPGREERPRLFRAILELLDRLGRDAPVVLVLEDLQLVDESTLELLRYISRLRVNERLLVIASQRVGELPAGHPLGTLIGDLVRARALDPMDLDRFGRDDVREYLWATIDAPVTHTMVERALDLTEGNALYLEEIVAAGSLLADSDDLVQLPRTIEDLLLPRYEALGEDAREVLGVASAIGLWASHQLLAAVCGLPEPRLLAALRECVAGQLLVAGPERHTYRFHHALVREVVYRQLIPGDRLRLHRAIARALADDHDLGRSERSTIAAQLSYHWFEARAFREALAAAVQAGEHAMQVLAFREASKQFDRALRVWGDVPEPAAVAGLPRHRLLSLAADAARWSGRLPHAIELARAAISDVDRGRDPVLAGELYERLGSYLWDAEKHADAEEAYAQAAALLDGTPPSAAAARLLVVQAAKPLRRGRAAEALELGRAALELARQVDARQEQGRAQHIIGVALILLAEVEDGITHLREAVRIAEEGRHLEELFRAYGNLALALEQAGRLAEALSAAEAGLDRIREAGLEHTRAHRVLANNASEVMVQLGLWMQATETIDQLVRDNPDGELLFPRLTLAVVKVGQGQFDDAERLLAQIEDGGGSVQQPWFVGGWYACRAEMAIWRGQPEAARAAILRALEVVADVDQPLVPLRLCVLGLRNEADEAVRLAAIPRTVRAELRTTESALEELSAWLDRLAATVDTAASSEPAALVALGQAERARATQSDHAAAWVAIADRWRDLERPYPRAYALWRAAAAEARGGSGRPRTRRARAGEAAGKALQIGRELNARPLIEAVESLVQRAQLELDGVTPGIPAQRSPVEKYGLTPRERQVLALLADGKSDREIAQELYIEVGTASTHVSNLLRKLGVRRRSEAAVRARELGLGGKP